MNTVPPHAEQQLKDLNHPLLVAVLLLGMAQRQTLAVQAVDGGDQAGAK